MSLSSVTFFVWTRGTRRSSFCYPLLTLSQRLPPQTHVSRVPLSSSIVVVFASLWVLLSSFFLDTRTSSVFHHLLCPVVLVLFCSHFSSGGQFRFCYLRLCYESPSESTPRGGLSPTTEVSHVEDLTYDPVVLMTTN